MILRKIRRGDKRKRGVARRRSAVGAAGCGGGVRKIRRRVRRGKAEFIEKEGQIPACGGGWHEETAPASLRKITQGRQSDDARRTVTLRSRRTPSSSCGFLRLRGLSTHLRGRLCRLFPSDR